MARAKSSRGRAFGETFGFLRRQVTQQRHQFPDMHFFFVPDVRDHGFRHRIVGSLHVRIIKVDGFQLSRNIQANSLNQFFLRQFAVDVALKRICKVWHTLIPFPA